MNRLYMALAAFVVLGGAVVDDVERSEIALRHAGGSGMFALKTWLRRNDVMHPDGESEAE